MKPKPAETIATIRLHESQRELIRSYVEAIGTAQGDWDVLNSCYGEFRDMALGLPNCRDLGESELLSLVIDATGSRAREDANSGRDQAVDVAATLITLLESLPRKYLIQVGLPAVQYWTDFELPLSDQLILKSSAADSKASVPNALARALLAEEAHLLPSPVRLELRLAGFATAHASSPTSAEAISRLKQATFLLTFSGALRPNWSVSRQADATLVDVDSTRAQALRLPSGLASLVGRLEINPEKQKVWESGSKSLLGGDWREAVENSERTAALQASLTVVQRFFSRSHMAGHARVAAAIEWYQDSLINDDQTMAFLAACIGLESIFGEEKGAINELSRRLIDRYAFMLGKDREDRDRLAQQFAEVLAVRGELVHARATRLGARDRKQLAVVQQMLWESIRHEVRPFIAAPPSTPAPGLLGSI